MIKIPLDQMEFDRVAEEFKNEIQANIQISRNIQNRPADQLSPVFAYLEIHIEEILKGKPDILENHIGPIQTLIDTAKTNYRIAHPLVKNSQVTKWAKTEIFTIFNYDFNNLSFTKLRNGELAYNHAQRFKLSTCPYCNSQFTFTIKNTRYKTRPHFDHFFPKAKHPYFALSFYNLIPSCYVCNSNLKKSKPFKFSTHIHPFIESIEGLYQFKTNIDSVDFLVNKSDFTIRLERCAGANRINADRAMRSLSDFEIEDRYNYHKDYIAEIITKSYFYNHSTIREFMEAYTVGGRQLFNNEGEIVELLLGNYVTENKLYKRVLSKITKDIANELGIII